MRAEKLSHGCFVIPLGVGAEEPSPATGQPAMHASFSFLIDLLDFDPATTQEELLDVADTWLRDYIKDYCGESNWHRLQAIVLPDGRMATPPFDPDQHVLELGNTSRSRRWEAALRISTREIARVCEVLAVGITAEVVLAELSTALPRELARTYAALSEPCRSESEPNCAVRNLRQCRLRNYEALCDARQDKLLLPFGYPTNPYDGVTCMDLRADPREGVDESALVFAALHL